VFSTLLISKSADCVSTIEISDAAKLVILIASIFPQGNRRVGYDRNFGKQRDTAVAALLVMQISKHPGWFSQDILFHGFAS
jgi:hypothetical protein